MSYIPYQVDYKVENASKTLGFAKKRITFKFGIANDQAIRDGYTGSQCRGSEHEILFIWSLKSGKRQILVDTKEVHYSESGQNGWTSDRTFQHHFNVNTASHGPVRCHLITLPPDPNAPGGNKPFELRVNGVSYFQMSKIFQLGTSAMIARPAPRPAGSYGTRGGYSHQHQVSPEERAAIAQAKLASLRDIKGGGGGMQREEASLISFDDPTPPPVQAPIQNMSSVSMDPALTGRQPSTDGSMGGPYGAPVGSGGGGYGANPYGASPYGAPAPAPPPPMPQPTPYSNYSLPSAPPPASAPAPGYGAPAPAPVYGGGYGGATTASAPAPYSNYALPPAPAGGDMGFASPPPSAAPPAAYGGYGAPAAAPAPPPFASPQSAVSYGSAPSFAQPPSQPNYGGGGTGGAAPYGY